MVLYERINAKINESLIVNRQGKIFNMGSGGSARIFQKDSYVMVPMNNQNITFQMSQTSNDGIDLRYKGILSYRISDPLEAAKRWDFTNTGIALENIEDSLKKFLMGELRIITVNMPWQDIIKNRDDITEKLSKSLYDFISGNREEGRKLWPIEVDIIQVGQVFIQSDEVVGQLQSTQRCNLRLQDNLNQQNLDEETSKSKLESEEKIKNKKSEIDKKERIQRFEKEQDELNFKIKLEEERTIVESDLERMKFIKKIELAKLELEFKQILKNIGEISTDTNLLEEKKRKEISREIDILTLEKLPEISKGLFGNSQIHITNSSEIEDIISIFIKKIKNI